MNITRPQDFIVLTLLRHCLSQSVFNLWVRYFRFVTFMMDIQTFLHNLHEDLHEEVSCSVCMTKFTDPKQLPCLHNFCLHCLQRIQETSGIRETISCPECRQDFMIPGGGDLNALPTNFRINSLLDVLAIKECNTSGVKCGNCDKRSGKCSYCFQCCSFWCDDCLPLHNGIRANKEHHALALKDFQDEDFENILKRPAFCGKPGHEKKELELFCRVCEVAICNTCAFTDHEVHAKMPLELAANERKLRVKAAIESQKRRAKRKENKLAKIKEDLVKVQEQAARVKRDVQQFIGSIFAAIEAKKMEIFDDVENKVKASLKSLELQRREIEEQVKKHETAIQKSETLLKRSTSAQIVQANEFLEKIFQKEADHLQDDKSDLDGLRLTAFVFVNNRRLFDFVKSEQIGFVKSFVTKTNPQQSAAEGKGISEATVGLEVQIVITTRNAEGEQCYEERDCVTGEIRNRQEHDCANLAQVQDNKDGTYKISYFAKETGTCQASVKVNGEHVHGSPFEVQVQTRQYKPISFGRKGWAAGMLNYPWGVAVNEKNEIAVTEIVKHRIQIFNSDGNLLRSFGREGSKQGEFNWPTGIVFHHDNIIVADSGNHRIQLFTDQGEYVGQFGGEGSVDHQLKNPRGLSTDSDGNIIVADLGNKLIKIFSPDGQFMRKIGTEGSFINPIYCIQHGDYLIVSDCDGDCVQVFNKEGKFLYKFGKKGNGDGEFNGPCCLSVSKADHLLVCDVRNHRVQVFELSGKFIKTFGTKGKGAGEFDWPFSTAVLSDGRIVLCDYRNHRVQIFE